MAGKSTGISRQVDSNNETPQMASDSGRLLAEIICPNCWFRFPPERLLFVARSDNLIGDDVVGPNAYRRFLPMRFNVPGDALDANGMACQQLACPRCHLEIARPLIEMLPYFVSMVGAPGSGKSYLLATMIWQMRNQAARMQLKLEDGDPTANRALQQYEEMLFLSSDPDRPVAIRKTEIQGSDLYQTVSLGGQRLTYPRPFQFTLGPGANRRGDLEALHRSLVLYDNAGEHFLPGQDTTSSPVTLHLAQSATILFLYDPTQDPRFRTHMKVKSSERGPVVSRQEIIFNEMASRVRRYKGIGANEKQDAPLVVILGKADSWLDPEILNNDPLDAESGTLDVLRIREVSDYCRDLLVSSCPEIVASAEAFTKRAIYMPVSSLGTQPEIVEQDDTRFYAIRPRNINPRWVTIPLWASLAAEVEGLLQPPNYS